MIRVVLVKSYRCLNGYPEQELMIEEEFSSLESAKECGFSMITNSKYDTFEILNTFGSSVLIPQYRYGFDGR